MTRICVVCGKPFGTRTGNQMCCSPECSGEWHRRKAAEYKRRPHGATRECPVCGKAFKPCREHLKYCSRACRCKAEKDRYCARRDEISAYNRQYNLEHRDERMEMYYYDRHVRPLIEACSAAHGGCFECPTEDGECLYE